MLGLNAKKQEDDLADTIVADSEYAVVSFKPSWGLFSIVLALLSLPLDFWAKNLPWHPTHYYYIPGAMVLGILGLSGSGLFFAWLGLRSGRNRGLSKVGLFLNGTVISVLILFVSIVVIYWRFLR